MEPLIDSSRLIFRNLRMAIASLISMYKDDFFEPPDYRNLQYLMEHIEHQDVREPCRNLLNSPWNHHNENGRRLDPSRSLLIRSWQWFAALLDCSYNHVRGRCQQQQHKPRLSE